VLDRRRGGVLAASLSNKGYDEARKNIEKLTTLFGKKSVYVELQRHCDPIEERRNQVAVRLAGNHWAFRFLLRTVFVMRARPSAKFWMSSPASEPLQTRKPPDGFWNVTTSVNLRSTEEMVQLFSDLPERFTTPANREAGKFVTELGQRLSSLRRVRRCCESFPQIREQLNHFFGRNGDDARRYVPEAVRRFRVCSGSECR